MADIAGANKLLDKFKSQAKAGKHEDAKDTLTDLKVKLVDFTALPPLLQQTATKDKELMLARDMLEHSVLLAVQLQARSARALPRPCCFLRRAGRVQCTALALHRRQQLALAAPKS